MCGQWVQVVLVMSAKGPGGFPEGLSAAGYSGDCVLPFSFSPTPFSPSFLPGASSAAKKPCVLLLSEPLCCVTKMTSEFQGIILPTVPPSTYLVSDEEL